MTITLTALAIDGVATAANEALLLAIIEHSGSVQAVRDEVEASPYWPAFRELVACGVVAADQLSSNSALAESVLAWARA